MARSKTSDAGLRPRNRWLWPVGVVAMIAFLSLTGFFIILLSPSHSKTTGKNVATASAPPQPAADVPIASNRSQTVTAPQPITPLLPASTVPPAQPALEAPKEAQAAPPASPEPSVTAEAIKPPPPDPFPPLVGTKPRVAILVADLGTDAAVTQRAIEELPPEIDLGFVPEAAAAHMKLAQKAGHRVWLGVPMQPKRYPRINPGPKTLLVGEAGQNNAAKLAWVMQQAVPDTVGVYNIMGSAFTSDLKALSPFFQAIAEKGYAFFDTKAGIDTIAARTARAKGISAILNDAYLDDDPAQTQAKLNQLAKRGQNKGVAVGVLGPSAQSITALKAWLGSPERAGVEIVSARSVAATSQLQKF